MHGMAPDIHRLSQVTRGMTGVSKDEKSSGKCSINQSGFANITQ
jgi:hypothetical protein